MSHRVSYPYTRICTLNNENREIVKSITRVVDNGKPLRIMRTNSADHDADEVKTKRRPLRDLTP